MGLLSKSKSGASDAPKPRTGAADATEIVREARTRARRRLIGAAMLLGVGIIGFPLLFETQPRPIAVDIPIEIPSREAVPPLRLPASRAGRSTPAPMAPPVTEPSADEREASAAEPAPAPASARPAAASAEHATTAKASASRPAEPKAESRPSESKPETRPKVETKPEPKAEARPDARQPAEPAARSDATKDDGRFVVQIGAFAEATSARDARMKVEAMGLKTYTQVIETAGGRRIRVRVGPYGSKAEAEKAAARIKSGGLQAAVLVL